ncbi:MAG TPA: sigma-70 region 4 domain-containing protein [Vicinamibacterales bacterium]|nr:sigma-70 region 4 domain-containing protein [Vicinamibacterales bacterium]
MQQTVSTTRPAWGDCRANLSACVGTIDWRILTPAQAAAFYLHHYASPTMSVHEIARRHEVAEQTVTVHLKRARGRLVDEYGREGIELAGMLKRVTDPADDMTDRLPCRKCDTPALPCDYCVERLMRRRG